MPTVNLQRYPTDVRAEPTTNPQRYPMFAQDGGIPAGFCFFGRHITHKQKRQTAITHAGKRVLVGLLSFAARDDKRAMGAGRLGLIVWHNRVIVHRWPYPTGQRANAKMSVE